MVLCRCDGFNSPDPIFLVQSSFHQIAPRLIAFGYRFYELLFEHNPELRPLFNNDLANQTRMLLSMLSSLVKGLNRATEIEGGLRALGCRHNSYRATVADYDKLSRALLLTLEEFLGDDLTPDIRDAWTAVFRVISGVMIEGAEGRATADELASDRALA
jgi:hemoglobin-like flavoprotein